MDIYVEYGSWNGSFSRGEDLHVPLRPPLEKADTLPFLKAAADENKQQKRATENAENAVEAAMAEGLLRRVAFAVEDDGMIIIIAFGLSEERLSERDDAGHCQQSIWRE
mmetsp:Transcript_6731/g.14581  ORF Transcript_6731/g.14581 Transcript_6731/m.14581 type:complete len:109 (+) Transcript_6731:634-960(+)